MIGYYDKLYDAHIANGSGQGSGEGERCGRVLEAHPLFPICRTPFPPYVRN